MSSEAVLHRWYLGADWPAGNQPKHPDETILAITNQFLEDLRGPGWTVWIGQGFWADPRNPVSHTERTLIIETILGVGHQDEWPTPKEISEAVVAWAGRQGEHFVLHTAQAVGVALVPTKRPKEATYS